MAEIKTNWEEIGISNDFIFGKVMQDPDLCKGLLERIFPEMEIDHIEYPELQKPIRPDVDARSVRLDVYVRDSNHSVYDIEIQTTDTGELPKRSRYYTSMMDLQLIDAGKPYKKLGRSYVIFICLKDTFGKGRHQYTFVNTCKEDSTVLLNDGTEKIFLNTDSQMEDVNPSLKAFLDYVGGKKSKDGFVDRLDDAVKRAKRNREWRHEYMTLLMRDQENIEKGIAMGIAQGREEGKKEGREEGKKEAAIGFYMIGIDVHQIAKALDVPVETVKTWVKEA